MISEPDSPESYEVREVFAYAGRALYLAQTVEHGIASLLVGGWVADALKNKNSLPRPITLEDIRVREAQFDGRHQVELQKALKKLISSLKASFAIDSSFCNDLTESLTIRNRLVHRYFGERAVEFTTADGRRLMGQELKAMGDQLESVLHKVEAVMVESNRVLGITEALMNRIGQMLQEAASEDAIREEFLKFRSHQQMW